MAAYGEFPTSAVTCCRGVRRRASACEDTTRTMSRTASHPLKRTPAILARETSAARHTPGDVFSVPRSTLALCLKWPLALQGQRVGRRYSSYGLLHPQAGLSRPQRPSRRAGSCLPTGRSTRSSPPVYRRKKGRVMPAWMMQNSYRNRQQLLLRAALHGRPVVVVQRCPTLPADTG
jgi:hypothetical protein